MDENSQKLELVELGEVSEETKGNGTSLEADNPVTPFPNRKPIA